MPYILHYITLCNTLPYFGAPHVHNTVLSRQDNLQIVVWGKKNKKKIYQIYEVVLEKTGSTGHLKWFWEAFLGKKRRSADCLLQNNFANLRDPAASFAAKKNMGVYVYVYMY